MFMYSNSYFFNNTVPIDVLQHLQQDALVQYVVLLTCCGATFWFFRLEISYWIKKSAKTLKTPKAPRTTEHAVCNFQRVFFLLVQSLIKYRQTACIAILVLLLIFSLLYILLLYIYILRDGRGLLHSRIKHPRYKHQCLILNYNFNQCSFVYLKIIIVVKD